MTAMQQDNLNLLADVLKRAKAAGADAADAVFVNRVSLSLSQRLGEPENLDRSEGADLGLRVFSGKRQAIVSSSDTSPAALAELTERAVAMARSVPEDPYCGLAPDERLARGPHPELDLYDPTDLSAASLETTAVAAEAAARAVPGVSNSEGASASWSLAAGTLVTSAGFVGSHRASGFSLSASAIAGEGGGMERGGEGRPTRHHQDLPGAEAVGAEAGRRAVSRLGARKLDSRTAPVLFENRLAISLISPMVGAVAGPAVARGVSFLKGKLGRRLYAPGVRISDDPLRPRGLGSVPFDDEGVAVERRAIVDDGVLTTWLLNTASARQLGMPTTGHASRGLAEAPGVSPHNLTVEPRPSSREALMRDVGQGLLVTSMFGPSLNNNTGDWSAGVSGFWFEGGEIAFPVTEITVAGNLIDIYARLVPANDLEFRGASNAPTLLVDALAVAGR